MLNTSRSRRFYTLVADKNVIAIEFFKIIEALFGLHMMCIYIDFLSTVGTQVNAESNAINIKHDLIDIGYLISLEMSAHTSHKLCSMFWAKNGSHFRLSY